MIIDVYRRRVGMKPAGGVFSFLKGELHRKKTGNYYFVKNRK
jgi:hypothetical protein